MVIRDKTANICSGLIFSLQTMKGSATVLVLRRYILPNVKALVNLSATYHERMHSYKQKYLPYTNGSRLDCFRLAMSHYTLFIGNHKIWRNFILKTVAQFKSTLDFFFFFEFLLSLFVLLFHTMLYINYKVTFTSQEFHYLCTIDSQFKSCAPCTSSTPQPRVSSMQR